MEQYHFIKLDYILHIFKIYVKCSLTFIKNGGLHSSHYHILIDMIYINNNISIEIVINNHKYDKENSPERY